MKSLHELAADVTRENLRKTLAALGGKKHRKTLHVCLTEALMDDLGIQAEIAAACSQEILAESTQEVLNKARTNLGFTLDYDVKGYNNFTAQDPLAKDYLPNVIRRAIDQLGDGEATIIVGPMVLTYLQLGGVLTRNEVDGYGLAMSMAPVEIGLFDGKYPVRVDQYADKDTPILVVKDGWFSYIGEKYVEAREVPTPPVEIEVELEDIPLPDRSGEKIFAYETDVKFTVHPDNFRVITGR